MAGRSSPAGSAVVNDAAATTRFGGWQDVLARARRYQAKPWDYAAVLVPAGFLLYNKWLTAGSLTSGDWLWQASTRLQEWFPWPTVWDPGVGFGLKNFGQIFEFPLFALAGLFSHLGIPWEIIEKLIYFWPLAALSLVAPWLLAREILGDSRWAVMSALLFAGNTYIVTESTVGHTFIASADVVAPLVLLAGLRMLQRRSIRWALISGILLAVQAAFDIRIAYLTLAMGLVLLVVLLLYEPTLQRIARRLLVTAVASLVFLVCEIYWWLPFLVYHGDHGLNLPSSPWIAFSQLTHGIAAVDPYWTWQAPSWFLTKPVNPVFLLIPALAFIPLLVKRVRPEILWLSICALAGAFLIKQQNPPLGEVYTWMFTHVPGWSMFRDATKLFVVAAIAYSILIPEALRIIARSAVITRFRLERLAAVVAGVGVAAVAIASLVPLVTGAIGSTTRVNNEPGSFGALRAILGQDRNYGSVFWIGSPWAQGMSTRPDLTQPGGLPLMHGYPPWSPSHPIVDLLGTADSGDPLSGFCRSPIQSFCYLHEQLFPYLAQALGAEYVVAPAGPRVGVLPSGVGYQALTKSITPLFGSPRILPAGAYSLAVWRIHSTVSPVVAAPAVAVVEGTQQETGDALPALQALGLPWIYEKGQVAQIEPPSSLTIDVVPNVDGLYHVAPGENFALLAQSTSTFRSVLIDQNEYDLRLLKQSAKPTGWGVYGPIQLSSGSHTLRSPDLTSVGPLIQWSNLASETLSGNTAVEVNPVSIDSERVSAASLRRPDPVVELRRTYDAGWSVPGSSQHLAGEGLLNLFVTNGGGRATTFSYSTLGIDQLAGALGVFAFLASLVALLLLPRVLPARPQRGHMEPRVAPIGIARSRLVRVVEPIEPYLASVGILLLFVGIISYTLQWLGLPLRAPEVLQFLSASPSDPFGRSEWYVAVAIGILGATCALKLLLQHRERTTP